MTRLFRSGGSYHESPMGDLPEMIFFFFKKGNGIFDIRISHKKKKNPNFFSFSFSTSAAPSFSSSIFFFFLPLDQLDALSLSLLSACCRHRSRSPRLSTMPQTSLCCSLSLFRRCRIQYRRYVNLCLLFYLLIFGFLCAVLLLI